MREEIALAILDYLHLNPDAKDTLGGIREWWLKPSRERRVADIESAISLLLSHALIVEMRREGLEAFYRLNQEKSEVIGKILKNRHL